MPMLDELDHHLRTQAPPPPTGDDLRTRRARRRQRRRSTALVGITLVAVVATGLVTTRTGNGDSPPQEVASAAGPTETTNRSTPATPVPTASTTTPDGDRTVVGVGASASPGTGLAAEGWVLLTLDPAPPDGTAVWITQCGNEAVAHLGTGAIPRSCNSTTSRKETPDPLRVWVDRSFRDGNGSSIDCATSAGRCGLGVRVGNETGTDDRWVPLTFLAQPGLAHTQAAYTPVPPTAGYADGDTASLTITNLEPGEVANVQQCRDTGGAPLTKEDCHQVGGQATTPADAGGQATISLTVHRQFPSDATGTVDCGACVLWISPVSGSDWIQVPIRIAP